MVMISENWINVQCQYCDCKTEIQAGDLKTAFCYNCKRQCFKELGPVSEESKLDQIFNYVKKQQSEIDIINNYIRNRIKKPIAVVPSFEAFRETGLDPSVSRATMILYFLEQFFKHEENKITIRKDLVIKFLRGNKILDEDKTEWIIKFEDGRKEDLVELITTFTNYLI